MSDFTYVPDYAFQETINYGTLITQYENGAEQRRSKWSSPRRSWSLNFSNLAEGNKNNLVSFFNAKKGQFTSFTWTNHNDSTEYTVRFDEDSLQIIQKAYQIYDILVKFIEVV